MLGPFYFLKTQRLAGKIAPSVNRVASIGQRFSSNVEKAETKSDSSDGKVQ